MWAADLKYILEAKTKIYTRLLNYDLDKLLPLLRQVCNHMRAI